MTPAKRAAQAMRNAAISPVGSKLFSCLNASEQEELAGAAIASLRMPSPKMMQAGLDIRYGREDQSTVLEIWTAMIDAALSDTSPASGGEEE